MAEAVLPFRPVQKRRAADHVAEQIRDQILAGNFPPGRRLPPERELAQTFGVNRTTLREALRGLEQQRLLDIHHGDGATVLDVRLNAGLELLAHLVRVDGRLDIQLLADILEARRIVGVALARLAALRAEPADIDQLDRVLDKMASKDISPERFQELDWGFFEALAQTARNRVFVLILNTIRPLYLEQRDLFLPLYDDREPVLALHRRLIAHLGRHDAARAADTMGKFLDLAVQTFPAIDGSGDDPKVDSLEAPGTGPFGSADTPGPSASPVSELPANWVDADSSGAGRTALASAVLDSSNPAAQAAQGPPGVDSTAARTSETQKMDDDRPLAPSAEPWLERSNR